MRDLISEFWSSGGGGLELSIEASDEVLACICRYIHTTSIMLPIQLSYQLELLRVANELQMNYLFNSTSEYLVIKLSSINALVIMDYCSKHGFSDLELKCRTYLNTGKKSCVANYKNNHEGTTDDASINLKNAIYASLQDVNAALGHNHHSSTTTTVISTNAKHNICLLYTSDAADD